MLGPLSIDMYLPAFRAIETEFDVPNFAVQQTLSSYLFAYAFMMLWHGALSDALGRRPIVLGGLAFYGLASLGCAIAGNIQSLWLFRTLQGATSGTGLVVGRAIIRDRFHGPEAQRLMSQDTLVICIAPALAPILGGAFLNLLGWRSIFWVMLAFVVGTLVWAARDLPETLPAQSRQPLHPRAMWRNYRAVLLHHHFLLLAAIPTCNFGAFFIYVASAPAYLESLGVTTWGFAWLFLPMITGIMLGATLSGRLAGRMSPEQTVALGYGFLFTGVLFMGAVVAFVPPGVPWHVLPLFVFAIGSSTVMPSVTLLLLDLFPTLRGLASSLQGFIQFLAMGIIAGTLAPLLAQSLVALAAGMAVFTMLSLVLWLVYRHSVRGPPSPRIENVSIGHGSNPD